MFVKIYDKVVKFIKEEYKFLAVLFLILFLGLYRLPYNLYMGGGLIDIKDRMSVENEYSEKGSFNMTYVKSSPATIPTYLLSFIFDWERESIDDIKLDDNDNAENIWKRDQIYLQEANDNAIISAYHMANENLVINKEMLKVLYIDKDSDTNLAIGDIILKIGDIVINSYDEMKESLSSYEIGEKVFVTILRDDKEEIGYFVVRDMEGAKKAGIYLVKLYDYDLAKKVEFNFPDKEGGPSGGLMLSLAIYNRLTSFDITKGRKVAGTGTIDENGHVGEIGGIKYKVMGAAKGDADVFFVPEENFEEAIKIKNEKGYDLNIVKVKTLSEAISYLRS